jgi:hypothetical protein
MVRPDRPKLQGTVEVDESYVGGLEEGVHGRGTSNPIAACAVERLEAPTEVGAPPARATPTVLGRVRLQVVEDATQVSLTTFASDNVEAGSTILTDGLSSYDELSEVGFIHERHVIGEPKNAPRALPGVHRIFALAKRWLLARIKAPSPRSTCRRTSMSTSFASIAAVQAAREAGSSPGRNRREHGAEDVPGHRELQGHRRPCVGPGERHGPRRRHGLRH